MNFGVKRNLNWWVTHGMVHACYVGDTWHDACMPCEFVWSIKTGSIEEKRGKKGKKKKEEKEREIKGYQDEFC